MPGVPQIKAGIKRGTFIRCPRWKKGKLDICLIASSHFQLLLVPSLSGFPRLSCLHLLPLILWLLPGPSRWLSTRLIIYLSTATLKHNYRPNRWNQNGHAVPVIAAALIVRFLIYLMFSLSLSLFSSLSLFPSRFVYLCTIKAERFNATINSRIDFDRIIPAKRIDRFTRSSELKFLTYIYFYFCARSLRNNKIIAL